MRFSERIGKRQMKVDIQINSMDIELKNSIWNVVYVFLIEPMIKGTLAPKDKNFIKYIWFSFFREPVDQIPFFNSVGIAKELRKRFFGWDYLEVYDFIDFLASSENLPFSSLRFTQACNNVLERELSAYRFVSGQLAPITNKVEISEIEKAISDSIDNNLKGVNIHLTNALDKLSDKKNPDYRNSIKESISAVESICQQITGESNAELGKTIKKLKDKFPIHSALEQGFIKLYG